MGKIINLDTEKKKNSLISHLLKGTPFEFNFLGKRFVSIGVLYKIKKQKEFFSSYWDIFTNGIDDIHPDWEFNTDYVAHRFNSLSFSEKFNVQMKCSEIYAYNDKLTYAAFIDVVNSYYSKEELDSEPDFSDSGGAA
jgi:hypothetical protein